MIPAIRHTKTKGEYAEASFLARAIALGFSVSKPFGDNHRFDYLVSASGRSPIYRIQVKSCWTRTRNAYYLNTQGTYHRRYDARDVDFIVGYVVLEEAWYVIPIRQIRSRMAVVFPHIPHSRGRLERFRERWDLLRPSPRCHPEPSRRTPTLTPPSHESKKAPRAGPGVAQAFRPDTEVVPGFQAGVHRRPGPQVDSRAPSGAADGSDDDTRLSQPPPPPCGTSRHRTH